MTQTLTRPSTLKARRIEPTGPIGDPGRLRIRKRRKAVTPSPAITQQLDVAIEKHGVFAPVPFNLTVGFKRRQPTDTERLEAYRIWLMGGCHERVERRTGLGKNASYFNIGYVRQHFEAVYA